MRRIRVGLVLGIFCLISYGRILGQAPASSIQVFMPNGGMPSHAILLRIVTDRGQTDNVFTDSKGVYLMRTPTSIAIGYTVTITSDRETYDTSVTTFRLERNTPARIPIFLRELSPDKRPTGRAAVVDAATLEATVPSKARKTYKQAVALISAGRFEPAIPLLQEAIRLYPSYVPAINDLGVAYMKLARFDEAAEAFRKAMELDKRFFHPRMNLGLVLNKQGKYKEAVEILEPLYSENRGILEVRLAYGQALGGAGQLADAEKLYRSTLESNNLDKITRANLYYRLGVVMNREGRFSEAATALQQAVALDPDAANSHVQLGAALMQLQEADNAERELLRGYELGGSQVGIAQLLLGQIYYAERKFGPARQAFEQYLKDVPEASNREQIAKLLVELKTNSRH